VVLKLGVATHMIFGLYYKDVHGQMCVIIHPTILAVKHVRSLWEKISFILYVHSQMSVFTDIWPWVQTFGHKFDVYNTEMNILQAYAHERCIYNTGHCLLQIFSSVSPKKFNICFEKNKSQLQGFTYLVDLTLSQWFLP